MTPAALRRRNEISRGDDCHHELGFTFVMFPHRKRQEVAITTEIFLKHRAKSVTQKYRDHRNLFRDGQSPHCILLCIYHTHAESTLLSVLYQLLNISTTLCSTIDTCSHFSLSFVLTGSALHIICVCIYTQVSVSRLQLYSTQLP